MAYWNMHERILVNAEQVVKNNIIYPLVFFHFSGFSPLKPDILSRYQNRYSFENRIDIIDLFKEYSEKLLNNNFTEFINYPCYYLIEKQKLEQNAYQNFKKSIPVYKRIFRGLILRFIKLFNINIEYYIK
jgi:hypothetical protein